MCGIVGYVGKKRVVPVILDGLRRLEYRGYDSAGIAVCGNGEGPQIRPREGKPPKPCRPAGPRAGGVISKRSSAPSRWTVPMGSATLAGLRTGAPPKKTR